MTGLVSGALPLLTGVNLILALWALVLLIVGRPMGRTFRITAGVTSGLMAFLAVAAILSLAAGQAVASVPTTIGYLLAGVGIPLASLWWTRTDASRAGSGVMTVAFLANAIVLVRIGQLWSS